MGPSPAVERIYEARHDPDGPADRHATVAHAIAEATGVDVTDGSFSLYDRVDPDALDAIFRDARDGRRRTGGVVAFPVGAYRVFVYADGRILIEPPI
nr:HalOD1 output domain-containing protein [Halovivax sp.]